MPNLSPLRYPGGKNRLAGFISLVIQNLNLPNCTYVEPFAGGAGVALSLLLDGTVNNIVINDYDKGRITTPAVQQTSHNSNMRNMLPVQQKKQPEKRTDDDLLKWLEG